MKTHRQVQFDKPSDRETRFTRVYDAPRLQVWRAWRDPDRLAKWWGPDGFTITTHHMDFKVGGHWKLTMHGPERDYANKIVYLEIEEPERIVYKHAGEAGDEAVNFTTVVTFETLGDNETKVTMRQQFNTAEDLKYVIETYHADKGGIQHMSNLAEYLDFASQS
jgi:uncharacterized protein YndB with AHSA1/START domain